MFIHKLLTTAKYACLLFWFTEVLPAGEPALDLLSGIYMTLISYF
jgi:hypothetical protein